MSALDSEKERAEFEERLAASYNADALAKRPNGDYLNPQVNGRWQGWLMAKRAMPPQTDGRTPVAWAIVTGKGGIHKLTIHRESAERKRKKRMEELPGSRFSIRPLVFADTRAAKESKPCG